MKVSRHKKYDYFVNIVEVAQNIKQTVPIVMIYPLLISMNSFKDKTSEFFFE